MVEKLNADKVINSPEKSAQSESSKMFNDQAIELNFVRNRLETFQTTVLRDVQKRMSGMIDEVMQELRQHELQTNEFRNFANTQMPHQKSNTWNNRINSPTETVNSNKDKVKEKSLNDNDYTNTSITNERLTSNTSEDEVKQTRRGDRKTKSTKKHHALPVKVFVTRESFLTALLEVDHMKTIYHIFYIIFIVFLLNNISYEYLTKGSVSFGLGTFKAGFADIHKVFVIWLLQHAFVFLVYYALQGWSSIRATLSKQKSLQHTWSVACLIINASTQIVFAYIPTQICLELNLPFVSASVLLCESIRLLMKMHSYVRTLAARVVSEKLKTDDEDSTTQVTLPPFDKYLYYLFAPTLIYRDSYPRTSTIRWKFALARFFEVVAVAFLYSYIYERHIKNHFGNFGQEDLNAASVMVKLFGMLMPGIIIFLCGFYMILHAWLNCTAELLRFGDRMFYKDWWTASNYEAYYRNWNVVVHDWLYEYIYKDFYTHVFKGSKGASSMTVFFISALFHEYILGYALQVVFPVMFFFFGIIGVGMIFLTRLTPKNLGNIFIWFSLVYGNCMMISLYSMEYFTRLNCPKVAESWVDNLVPHIWSCYNNSN